MRLWSWQRRGRAAAASRSVRLWSADLALVDDGGLRDGLRDGLLERLREDEALGDVDSGLHIGAVFSARDPGWDPTRHGHAADKDVHRRVVVVVRVDGDLEHEAGVIDEPPAATPAPPANLVTSKVHVLVGNDGFARSSDLIQVGAHGLVEIARDPVDE